MGVVGVAADKAGLVPTPDAGCGVAWDGWACDPCEPDAWVGAGGVVCVVVDKAGLVPTPDAGCDVVWIGWVCDPCEPDAWVEAGGVVCVAADKAGLVPTPDTGCGVAWDGWVCDPCGLDAWVEAGGVVCVAVDKAGLVPTPDTGCVCRGTALPCPSTRKGRKPPNAARNATASNPTSIHKSFASYFSGASSGHASAVNAMPDPTNCAATFCAEFHPAVSLSAG
ncbi:MAG: hypothetical protein OHK0046_42830 [Anaerolineae bacterium]